VARAQQKRRKAALRCVVTEVEEENVRGSAQRAGELGSASEA
jgi:hypothetical protein